MIESIRKHREIHGTLPLWLQFLILPVVFGVPVGIGVALTVAFA